MKKLLSLSVIQLLSFLILQFFNFSTVNAQTFVVVDKQGNRNVYDVSKLDSVTFQSTPPGITVYNNVDVSKGKDKEDVEGDTKKVITKYTFGEVNTFLGEPEFLFVHPDTVYVDGEGEDFSFQLRTSVEYDFTFSDSWLKFSDFIDETDSLVFIAGPNPSTTQRMGYIAFAGKDGQMRDTMYVVQYGKYDSRYIDIDWNTTTLNSFNENTGEAVLTFAKEVPVMGNYDVVLLPNEGSYSIRLINSVQQQEGSKTVTLATREGVMGNLFKDTSFTLSTDVQGQAKSRGYEQLSEPVYTPTKIEILTDDHYVEVFNAEGSSKSAGYRGGNKPVGLEYDFINWEYNDDGRVLWESGVQSLSWDKLNFNLGLKGLFHFDFGDIPWEEVRMGDLQNLRIALEGGFNMEMVMKYAVKSEVSYEREWTLKKNAIPTIKYTFTVGTVPVYITVDADLMANISLGASGEASISAGIQASNTVTYGVEWDAQKGLSKIAECEKSLNLVGPDVNIQAHAEARATAYPKIEIGIYKVLCPTISPQPYIKAEADGRFVDNNYVAWNAGISTGVDLGLGLSLDLFFFKKDLGEIDPINVFDLPIVSLPDEIELLSYDQEEMLLNKKREIKYHVTNKNYLTGTTYNAPAVLVHFEAEGGELDDEYGYTDREGNVSAFFTLTDLEGGKVKAEVVLGSEGDEEEGEENEDAIKADDWNAIAIDYRLTSTPASQNIQPDATAAITYKLERYTSKTGEWTGYGGQTVQFEASGGTVAPVSGVTAADGIVSVTFTPETDATDGTVTGTATGSKPDSWIKTATATVKVTDEDDISDVELLKAAKRKENEYVIYNKETGESETRTYVPKWSEWYKDQDAVSFTLEDADEDGGTLGMVYGFIPLNMTDQVLPLTVEQFANSPGMKIGFGLYVDVEISGDFATFSDGVAQGNILADGSSKIMLRQVKQTGAASKGFVGSDYTGEYELLFYLVFKNRVWNQETGEEEDGDEYEIYGRGTMKMHIPSVTSFVLNRDKDWVRVGETATVSLESFYEEGATWDWSDVQLKGQSTDYTNARNGEDEGFFSWDAATQTLTALKSNDNKRVYVNLSLISKPGVSYTVMIATGEGWKYTTLGTSVDEITCSAPSYPSFDMTWAPKDSDSEKFDYTSVELDPDSAPEGYFQFPSDYASQGWPLSVTYKAQPGEYNLKFRLKSNHDVFTTLKVTITESE